MSSQEIKTQIPFGSLIVYAHEARSLRSTEMFGKNDPFARFKLSDESQKTRTVDNAGDACSWEESLTFTLSSKEDQVNMVVQVVNRNPIKDSLIGDVRVQVIDLIRGVNKKWFQLTYDNKLSGEICLSSKYTPALHLEVNECKNLRSVQLIGRQDPFVKLTIRGGRKHEEFRETHQTVVNDDGGKNPKWASSDFFFHLPPENSDYAESEKPRIEFEIINHNLVKNDLIGTGTIPYDVLKKSSGPTWYPVMHGSKQAGEICLTVLPYAPHFD